LTEIKIYPLPPQTDCESVAVLKALNGASRALGQLKGEISKIPNSQILLDTLILQEAKDSNEIENIVTTDDEMYQASIDETVASITAKEALNYASAIKLGLDIVKDKGLLTTNDIFRIQNIIAPNHPIRKVPGTVLKNPKTEEVVFTPPQDYNEITALLRNLEQYINLPEFHAIDPLIKMPIIHFMMETAERGA
jgi:Fic family protein